MSRTRKLALLSVIIFMFNMISPVISVSALELDTQVHNEELKNIESNNLGDSVQDNTLKEEVELIEETSNDSRNLEIISNMENPLEGHILTEDFYLKGWAISGVAISKVEIYLDGKYHGQANYGLSRKDIGDKYSNYYNAYNSGFDYHFKGVPNGSHSIKAIIHDSQGKTSQHEVSITVNNQKTNIMGKGTLSKVQMVKLLKQNNPYKSYGYIDNFVELTISEASIEGVNHDVLFAQIMHETGYLKFGGDVSESQNNFAGIGATGNGNPGNSFPSIQIGIRAVVQHLKAYASTQPLNQECVDPRFTYVQRGTALYVEHLGIKENPLGKGWAAAQHYGIKVLSIIDTARTMTSTIDYSIVTNAKVTGEYRENNQLTFTAEANPTADSLYKLWVCDRSTNTWTVLSDWSSRNSVIFTPTKVGNYTLTAHVKHKNSKEVEENDYKSIDITVKEGKAKLSKFEVVGDKLIDSELTLQASATPSDSALYKFWICDRSTNKWTVLSDWSTTNVVKTKVSKAGNYSFVVHVKHKSNTTNNEDDYRGIDLVINNAVSKVTDLTVTGNKYVNQKLTMTAKGSPSDNTLYKLWVCDRSTNTWTVLSDYSTKDTIDFTPKKAGRYTFTVHVKHKNSVNREEDDYKSIDVNVENSLSKVSSLEVTGDKLVGSKLTMTATGTPAADTLYKLWVCDRSTNTWTVLSDYSTKNTVDFTPKKAGRYTFTVHVKNKYSNNKEEDDYRSMDVQISSLKSTVTKLDVTGTKMVGSTLRMTAEGTPAADTLYKLWVCDRSTNTWTVLSDYSTKNTVDFTPKKAGRYTFTVHVKHKNSDNKEEDDYRSMDVQVSANYSKVTKLDVTGSRIQGSKLTMTAEGTPAADTLYKLWVCDRSTNTWSVLSDYSAKNTVDFTPQKVGRYTFTVHVKHKNSDNKEEDDYRSMDVQVEASETSKVSSFEVLGDKVAGSRLTMKATGTPASDTLYKLWVCDRSTNKWTVLSDYSSRNEVSFTPETNGRYTFTVHVKHKNSSNKEEDDYRSIDVEVKGTTSKITKFELTGNKMLGSTITMNVQATPEVGTLYKLWVCDRSTNTWTVLSDWSNKSSVSFKPSKVGKYTFTAHVKHKSSSNKEEDNYYSEDVYVLEENKSLGIDLKVDGPMKPGEEISISAKALPENESLYKIWIGDRQTGEWKVISDYSATNSVKYKINEPGRYTVTVHFKHKKSTSKEEDTFLSQDIIVKSNKLIVIDPGHNHGGDYGATAIHQGISYLETDLNMQVAVKLRSELEKKGYSVIMTRYETDRFYDDLRTSLRKRTELANSINADLFISIHHNSFTNSSVNGVEVYYSSESPISRGILLGNGIEITPERGFNINERSSKVVASKSLATNIVNQLSSQVGYYNRGARDEAYYVVKNTTMPSVLVECGYISNPDEARKVANPTIQTKVANVIADAVDRM